ncbi:MAG: hypothetical protein QM737_18870 [Ferruginibacter sp.]
MDNLDYTSFAETCVTKLNLLQDKFREQYDLDWYHNWFYNQSTGLLTFSTGEVELNFRYFDVGSFSKNSNTWKWSWDNDSTLDSIKEQTNIVRDFGLRSNFPKLIDGYFSSDEFEAWEFVAIAAFLTKGIGVYRPVNENQLQIFLVITEFIDNEHAQNIKDKFVQCTKHEYARRAFVCQHLNHETKVGFEEAFETFENMELNEEDDFQAWCDECEIIRQQKGGWNDESMASAKIKIVCEKCYFNMKELNLGYR